MSSVPNATVFIPWTPPPPEEEKRVSSNEDDDQLEQEGGQLSFDGSKGIAWRALFNFTSKGHIPLLALAVLLSMSSALVLPFTAILFGDIFRELARLGNGSSAPAELLGNVGPYILKLFGVGCFSWIINGLFFGCWLSFGVVQAKSARDLLFESCLRVKKRWAEESGEDSSVLTPRCQTQIDEIQSATSQPLGFVIQAVASATISLGVALYYCWSLTLVIVAGLPVSFAVLSAISLFMTPHIQAQEVHMSLAARIFNQALSAIDTVKIFNGQKHERDQYSSTLGKAAKSANRIAKWNAIQIGLFRFLTLSMFVQGFWYGSRLVRLSSDQATVRNVMTTFWSCLMAAQSVELILPQLIFLEKGRIAAASLWSTISYGDLELGEGEFVSGNLKPAECRGEIEMTGVNFSYPASDKIRSLENMSLSVAAGQTVFITGHSGSGKSTIGSLLLRLWERDSGSITVDGINVEELSVEWLRRNIMVIQQNSPLFNESIFRNVAFGSPEHEQVTQKAFDNSCKGSHLSDVLVGLTNSIETMVGPYSNELSGGQRQRVGIARARIRDSPILVLDESTSALDGRLKESVMQEIREWRQGKTTIIITHDLDQIGFSDFVYVLEAGRVVQSGTRAWLQRDVLGSFETLRRAGMTVDNEQYQIYTPEFAPPPLVLDYQLAPGQTGVSMEELRHMTATYLSGMPGQIEYDESPIIYDVGDSYSQRGLSSYLNPVHTTQYTVGDGGFLLRPMANPGLDGEFVTYGQHRANFNRNYGAVQVEKPSAQRTVFIDEKPQLPVEQQQFPVETPEDKIVSDSEGIGGERILEPATFASIFASICETLDFKDRCLLAMGFASAFVNALSTPVFSFCLAKVLLTFFSPEKMDTETGKWSLIVLVVAVVDAASIFGMQYLLDHIGQIWIDRLRTRGFFAILQQDRSWFDKDENTASHVAVDLDSHAEEMRNLLARFAGYAFIGVIMMAASVIWSLVECWKLTIVGLGAAPILYLIARLSSSVSNKWEITCNEENVTMSAILHETVSNLHAIRALILERHFRQKFAEASMKVFRCGLKRAITCGLAFGISDSAILFATALVFYYGTYLVASGVSTIQSVMSVFSLLLFCLANANIIFGMIPQISNSKESARRVLRLSNIKTLVDSSETESFQEIQLDGSIRLDKLRFSYPTSSDVEVLKGISLHILPGQVIALIGASGSGKSTIAQLLQRLYSETSGSVMFNSVPAGTISEHCIHEQVACVPQRSVLFNTTIRENIIYGIAPEKLPCQSEIEDAAKAASIHDWISSLPNGYDTVLRNGESGLSGGQAQRIAIARALVRKPKVLILDECTASLDAESARHVSNAILKLRYHPGHHGKTTVIMITHKHELMAISDRVVTIDQGRVIDDSVYGRYRYKAGGRRC